MAPPGYGQVSLLEKVGAFFVLARAGTSVLLAALGAAFGRADAAPTFKDRLFQAYARVTLSDLSIGQSHYLSPHTDDVYAAWCKSKGIQPLTDEVGEGGKAHWLGSRQSSKVIVFFHGGGYARPAADYYFPYMDRLRQKLGRQGLNVSIVVLSYTLVPHGVYPEQLSQGVSLLRHLLDAGKLAENIVLWGDSAGGHLILGILSHTMHKHAHIATLDLSKPLAGAVLISPWVSFDTSRPSYQRNHDSDMFYPRAVERWAKAFVIDAAVDAYNEPARAPASWWLGLDKVVDEMLVYGGERELLIDSIRDIAATLSMAHGKTTTLLQPRGFHESILSDFLLGKAQSEYDLAVDSWLSARLRTATRLQQDGLHE